MDHGPILADLIEIVTDIFGGRARNLGHATTASDVPGWDSMQMINIIMTVQDKFDIELENEDIDRVQCLGDFADLVAEKLTPVMA